MLPDAASWALSSAYDYWDDLTPEGVAWEFLRRNGDYQREFAEGTADPEDWGLRTLRDPALTGLGAPVHWTPGLNPSEILFAPQPLPPLSSKASLNKILLPGDGQDDLGLFGAIGQGSAQLQISYLGDHAANAPLCVVIPFDTHLNDRLDALYRLRHILDGRPAPDHRLTADKRRRTRSMAQAFDARTVGATQREIAQSFFGQERVNAEHWKTSSLRYTTLRLLQDAENMVEGGYLGVISATPIRHNHPNQRLT